MLVCTLKVMVFYFNLTRIKKDNKIIRTGFQNNSRVGYISMEQFLGWRTVIKPRLFLWIASSLLETWLKSKQFQRQNAIKTSFNAKLSLKFHSTPGYYFEMKVFSIEDIFIRKKSMIDEKIDMIRKKSSKTVHWSRIFCFVDEKWKS